MNNFEWAKIWKANEAERRQGNVGNQLPAIVETGANGNDFGAVISKGFGNLGGGIRSHFQNNRGGTQKKRGYGMLSWGCVCGDVIMGDIEEVVRGERLELRGEKIPMVRKQEKHEERKVLMAVALMGI